MSKSVRFLMANGLTVKDLFSFYLYFKVVCNLNSLYQISVQCGIYVLTHKENILLIFVLF